MPRKLQIDSIRSELAAIDGLIGEARQVDDPVGLLQFEIKQNLLETELAELQRSSDEKASVALFFGGEPVLGSRGINAEFAGKALETFQEVISKMFAQKELGSMGQRGKVPMASATQLMITEVAKGSFGFVLDELSDQMEMTDTKLKTIVDSVASLIEDTAHSDNERFEAAMELIDHRTLKSLTDFFVTLDSGKATLRLIEGDEEFELDHTAIERARARTESTAIEDQEQIIEGKLRGFLPDHRKFELLLATGVGIWGSTTKQAAEYFDMQTAAGNDLIGKQVVIKAVVRLIRPLNREERTTYRLVEFLDASLSE